MCWYRERPARHSRLPAHLFVPTYTHGHVERVHQDPAWYEKRKLHTSLVCVCVCLLSMPVTMTGCNHSRIRVEFWNNTDRQAPLSFFAPPLVHAQLPRLRPSHECAASRVFSTDAEVPATAVQKKPKALPPAPKTRRRPGCVWSSTCSRKKRGLTRFAALFQSDNNNNSTTTTHKINHHREFSFMYRDR